MNQQLSVDIYNIITVYVLEHFEGVKYTNLASAIPAFPFQKKPDICYSKEETHYLTNNNINFQHSKP